MTDTPPKGRPNPGRRRGLKKEDWEIPANLQPDPGDIVDATGQVIGRHQGLMYYTLGQRRGLGIGGQRGARDAPWYVIAKQAEGNRLVVAQDGCHPLLLTRQIVTAEFHWIAGDAPAPVPALLQARIRHRQAPQDCSAKALADGRVRVRFFAPQRAAVAGQYLVLYAGDECLGGGEIDTALPLESPAGAER